MIILTNIILLRTLLETLLVSVGMGMGGNRVYFSGINGNWTIVENGNGNEVMGMGGNGYRKIIPAHL